MLSPHAHATREFMLVPHALAAVCTGGINNADPITISLLAVLGVLLFSYRQTIKAYPQAGGAYLVTRDNFGILPAQVAGVALLTDYILTVSVSVAAGIAALTSISPGLDPYKVPMCLVAIAIIAMCNLR